jgi:23S rRNA (uracil1939-C5)-methyltransferase
MTVAVDKEYKIEIDSITSRAEGVGRVDGFTVFVPQAIPGDVVIAKVISKKKSYARALIKEIVIKSKDRVKPFCKYYYQCGGCQLQHLDYKKQLEYKKQQVIDAFERIGKLTDFIVNDVIGMEAPKLYRNKSSMPVSGEKSNLSIGFYKPRSHDLVDIEECLIQESIINEILKHLRKMFSNFHIEPFNEKTNQGILRHIVVRVAPNTQEVLVTFVVNGSIDMLGIFQEITNSLVEKFEKIKGVIVNINKKNTNVIFGNENVVLEGKNEITDLAFGKKFLISARSFYQINGVQTKKLYQAAIDMLDLTGDERILDAYCGTGTIGIILSDFVKEVIGVEINKAAIEDAIQNAKVNEIRNINFIQGKAEDEIPKIIKDGYKPDILVVDPPRKGCDELLINMILDEKIEQILYISCNPSTLARDIKQLVDGGYEIIKNVQPVDMFPQTAHVETVVALKRE